MDERRRQGGELGEMPRHEPLPPAFSSLGEKQGEENKPAGKAEGTLFTKEATLATQRVVLTVRHGFHVENPGLRIKKNGSTSPRYICAGLTPRQRLQPRILQPHVGVTGQTTTDEIKVAPPALSKAG